MSSEKMNISHKNIAGKCDLKCSYNFKYSESNITAKNNGIFISLNYDNSSVPPVVYNNEKYNVSTILITCPSIHLFNNQTLPAEIIIEHIPVKGGKQLSVTVPIKSSSESSSATKYLSDIIQGVASSAPADGESTNMNIPGFTLNYIVPKKPFYSYTHNNIDWIVFGHLEAIPLSSKIIDTLSKIIKPYSVNTPKLDLFYNSKGPNTTTNFGDGIYISCKPTGSSKEETAVVYDKPPISYDLMSSEGAILIFQIIVGCFVFILLFFIFNYGYNYLTSDGQKIQLFSFGKKA
jgi:carbonic anhydrase